MNLTLAQLDLIAEAVNTLNQLGQHELAHALDEDVVAEFWANYEPTPPVYDGPYGPDNPRSYEL